MGKIEKRAKSKWKIKITKDGEIVYDKGVSYTLTVIRGHILRKLPRKSAISPLMFVVSTRAGKNAKTGDYFYPVNHFCRAWGELADKLEKEYELNEWVDVVAHYCTDNYHGKFQSYFKVVEILGGDEHDEKAAERAANHEDYVGTEDLPY